MNRVALFVATMVSLAVGNGSHATERQTSDITSKPKGLPPFDTTVGFSSWSVWSCPKADRCIVPLEKLQGASDRCKLKRPDFIDRHPEVTSQFIQWKIKRQAGWNPRFSTVQKDGVAGIVSTQAVGDEFDDEGLGSGLDVELDFVKKVKQRGKVDSLITYNINLVVDGKLCKPPDGPAIISRGN
jgi:hypothetical protein